MRLYTFTNFMLSSIQQGIQPAHLVSELFIKYRNELHDIRSPDYALYDWAEHHRTMICLNGGNNQELTELYSKLTMLGFGTGLPFGSFYEDEQSLNSLMTCCGIVVPAKIYEAAEKTRVNSLLYQITEFGLDAVELELAYLLNEYNLAR